MSRAASPVEQSGRQPLVWLLMGTRAGDNNQLLALAEALGYPFEAKRLTFNQLRRFPFLRRRPDHPRPVFSRADRPALARSRNLCRLRQRSRRTLHPPAVRRAHPTGAHRQPPHGAGRLRSSDHDPPICTPRNRQPAPPAATDRKPGKGGSADSAGTRLARGIPASAVAGGGRRPGASLAARRRRARPCNQLPRTGESAGQPDRRDKPAHREWHAPGA